MYEIEVGILALAVTVTLIYVVKSWKDVKSAQFQMEAARSRRMSQVRAARGSQQAQPARAASNDEQETIPEWVYPILERLGIDEIPAEEPPGVAEALQKYEPFIRGALKGLMEPSQQQQQEQQQKEAFL